MQKLEIEAQVAMGRCERAHREWSAGDKMSYNFENMWSDSSSKPMEKSLRSFGKSKSFPASTKTRLGPEDDCVIAERLAQLCLAKYPSSSAIPPPKKFEKQISSFNFERAYSAPVYTDNTVDKVNFFSASILDVCFRFP